MFKKINSVKYLEKGGSSKYKKTLKKNTKYKEQHWSRAVLLVHKKCPFYPLNFLCPFIKLPYGEKGIIDTMFQATMLLLHGFGTYQED